MTYLLYTALAVAAFVIMCQWCRNADQEKEVDRLTAANSDYAKRIATLIEEHRAAYAELAAVSASQLIELVELESRCDALSNPRHHRDLGSHVYN